MRNVSRGSSPDTLRRNKRKWTTELLAEIKKSKKTGKKVPNKYYDKYKKDGVKNELMKMYGDSVFCYCCYCESIINVTSYEHIEHRMPKNKTKDKYPKKTFEWKNLHLSCGKCNISKGVKYDEEHPILDATIDPIKDHLGYLISYTGKGVYRKTLSERGITTVKHADLDRDSLRFARLKVYSAIMEAIEIIKDLDNSPEVYTRIKMLRDRVNEEHGSLIEYLLDKHDIQSV